MQDSPQLPSALGAPLTRTVFDYNSNEEEEGSDVHALSTPCVPGIGWDFMRIFSLDPHSGLRHRRFHVFAFSRRACNGDLVQVMY